MGSRSDVTFSAIAGACAQNRFWQWPRKQPNSSKKDAQKRLNIRGANLLLVFTGGYRHNISIRIDLSNKKKGVVSSLKLNFLAILLKIHLVNDCIKDFE